VPYSTQGGTHLEQRRLLHVEGGDLVQLRQQLLQEARGHGVCAAAIAAGSMCSMLMPSAARVRTDG
jgi:hypothetical protein